MEKKYVDEEIWCKVINSAEILDRNKMFRTKNNCIEGNSLPNNCISNPLFKCFDAI
jgi:hypothetical protein